MLLGVAVTGWAALAVGAGMQTSGCPEGAWRCTRAGQQFWNLFMFAPPPAVVLTGVVWSVTGDGVASGTTTRRLRATLLITVVVEAVLGLVAVAAFSP